MSRGKLVLIGVAVPLIGAGGAAYASKHSLMPVDLAEITVLLCFLAAVLIALGGFVAWLEDVLLNRAEKLNPAIAEQLRSGRNEPYVGRRN